MLAWVEEAVGSGLQTNYWSSNIALGALASGQVLQTGKPDARRRFVLAAVAQVGHWDRVDAENGGRTGTSADQREFLWGRRRQTIKVIDSLVRRALPFTEADLIVILLGAGQEENQILSHPYPFGPIVEAVERFAATASIGPDLGAVLGTLAAVLKAHYDKKNKQLGSRIERLIAPPVTPTDADVPPPPGRAAPQPAPAGDPRVLVLLKRHLGIAGNGNGNEPTEPTSTPTGDDQFSLRADSPLAQEHAWLGELITANRANRQHLKTSLGESAIGSSLQAADPAMTGRLALAAAERHIHALIGSFRAAPGSSERDRARYRALEIAQAFLTAPFTVDRPGLFDLLLFLATQAAPSDARSAVGDRALLRRVDAVATEAPLTEGERFVLALFRAALISGPPLGKLSEPVREATRLIGDEAGFFLTPGEVWSDASNADLTGLPPTRRQAWVALLEHALGATSSRPSARWLARGGQLVTEVGGEEVQQALLRWFPLVAREQTVRGVRRSIWDVRGAEGTMHDENANVLKGLLWLVSTLPRPNELVRALTTVALSSYKKIPEVGPRAIKVGNAAVFALAELKSTAAVGQLALLKVRVKFGTAQKEIEKAFTTAATALDLPRDQIEELGVPSYGLEAVGRRSEAIGDYRAELVVAGTDAELKWFDAQGKGLKAVPAPVKRDHKDDLKEWQEALKDISAMLPAQRDRIDGLFLAQKSWPIADWLDRYGNHPLVGTIARRLIWRVDGTSVVFLDGTPTDLAGNAITPEESARVTCWHPVECSTDEVLAWRDRLEALGVTQPFKQAHREVYLLTDAERRTNTYSNRFAAHILRQHQFNALCAARGWKNALRLMVDNTYAPPTKELPGWNLRAEFWVEGIGADFGTDTNESGVYLRLSTDQVRFYRTGAAANWVHAGGGQYTSSALGPGTGGINEPLPLDQIPALVLSEVLRDVDLFVGVASVGNDPTWNDGGPQGRYQTYWRDYSFGALSGTAATRKQVLERLVPRLKIARQCSFEDRFLKVQGQKRTYKIHLGSGNILMEPNDQYLCIVPDARTRGGQTPLFLPFEGDNMLSIILSKALLLADDSKIKDSTILSQINHR